MFSKLSSYIEDSEFRLTLYTNKLHIINYKEILSLTSGEVILDTIKGKIHIYGEDMSLLKLASEEVLLSGKIKKIEVDFND